ncbi:PREDICTED: uncharacterized protein LOC109236052 [Nicotiana attenuata]|uniref:uncharacterized protein LOC109236052 n=1 Tax=Nicotiana attenuata TaxID=49451 RepID=UPI000905A40D|nr:PREDICTED: uncharacterized protein LOC109236052 [Nicotiana attenuata]
MEEFRGSTSLVPRFAPDTNQNAKGGRAQKVRSQDRLQGFDPELERIFHRRLREARDTDNLQALVQLPMNMAEEQHMIIQEMAMPSIANVISSIVKPRITGHFELKQSMIQLLHANGQFLGLPHEYPQQYILNFLEISDTYITNKVTPNYVRLTLFPFSLLGEAKRWLKAEPTNSITSWNDLARKFLAWFFPSGKTAKIRSKIVAFKQKSGESLYSAWERFKGLLRDCPHHNQTNEVLAHTFIEGLHLETKVVVDATARGQVLDKSFDKIYALLNTFSKSNPDWQGEMGRHIAQKSAGVLELDVVSALSSQVATLANQVNKMTLVINKQQAQPVQQVQIFFEVCGEGYMRNLCPANPESVYFVGNANQAKANQYGDAYNPNWRNHPNFSWGGNQAAQNQYRPQAPQQQYILPQVVQPTNSTSHIEEMLKKLMADQQVQAAAMRNLERQIGQLASAQNT